MKKGDRLHDVPAHEYLGISLKLVWLALIQHLPALRTVIDQAVRED